MFCIFVPCLSMNQTALIQRYPYPIYPTNQPHPQTSGYCNQTDDWPFTRTKVVKQKRSTGDSLLLAENDWVWPIRIVPLVLLPG